MKKQIGISIVLISACSILIITLLVLYISPNSRAWFFKSDTDTITSAEIMSINHGYGNNVSSFMNDENFDPEMLALLLQENEEELEEVFMPGDIVYYSFIIRLNYNEDLNASTTSSLNIDLVLLSGKRDTWAEGKTTGEYETFLSNLTIEENSIKLGLLEVTVENDEIVYDDNGDPIYSIKSHTVNNEDEYFYDMDNTEVSSFYTNNQVSADFDITLDSTTSQDYSHYTIDGSEYTFILLLVPIWYKDTKVNQNIEMDSRLNIVTCVISKNDD